LADKRGLTGASPKKFCLLMEQNQLCRLHDRGRAEAIEMRRLPIFISLDPLTFLKVFAAGLQAQFADAARAPLPEYLAALMRELEDGDQKPPTPNLRNAA
jgi:hypothetical protein